MKNWKFHWKYGAVAVLLLALTQPAHAGQPLTVFAAASLTDALAEVGQRYEHQSDNDIKFPFASSSTLARQSALAHSRTNIFLPTSGGWTIWQGTNGLCPRRGRICSPIGSF